MISSYNFPYLIVDIHSHIFRHIESMFQSLDPSGVGSISLEQYRTGMKTLGISEYDQKPVECEADRVDKQTFQAEA